MSSLKINSTKNYRLFTRSSENRVTNCSRRKRLRRSFKKYGFLPYFPIVCKRENGKLVVMEGQHRLEMAETLGLAVHWVEADKDFDIAEINGTAEVWKLKDYAEKFSNNGVAAYTAGLEFASAKNLPLSIAFALLAGQSSFSAIQESFIAGNYKIRDSAYADAVANIYGQLRALSRNIHNSRCLQACMMLCRVKDFSATRLLEGAARCRDKLVAYSTRDAYLQMFEEIYNYNRTRLVGLKAAATQAMRNRNPVVASQKKKASKSAA